MLHPERQIAQRWTFYIGPDGRILDIDTSVKAQTAGQDVIKHLEALKIKKK